MANMTDSRFKELIEQNLKKYFNKNKFKDISDTDIKKFTTVKLSSNNFSNNIIDEYNSSVLKTHNKNEDYKKYILSIDKERELELNIINSEKKEIKTEIKESIIQFDSIKQSDNSNKQSDNSNKQSDNSNKQSNNSNKQLRDSNKQSDNSNKQFRDSI